MIDTLELQLLIEKEVINKGTSTAVSTFNIAQDEEKEAITTSKLMIIEKEFLFYHCEFCLMASFANPLFRKSRYCLKMYRSSNVLGSARSKHHCTECVK